MVSEDHHDGEMLVDPSQHCFRDDDDDDGEGTVPELNSGIPFGGTTVRTMKAGLLPTDNNHSDTTTEVVEVGKHETRGVVRLRIVVALVLVCSAIAVALCTYKYISHSEQQQFQDQFIDDSNKILSAIGSSFDKTFGLLDNVAATLVSHARDSHQSWPFVTLPNFAFRMMKLLPITNTVLVVVYPTVTRDQRTQWEHYSTHHDDWVNETLHLQETWDGYYGSTVYTGPQTTLFGDYGDIPIDPSGPFHLPGWQSFPSVPYGTSSYNWDFMNSSYSEILQSDCLNVNKAIMTKPFMIPDPDDPVEQKETELWSEWYESFLPPGEAALAPMGDIVYPILDVVDHLSSGSRIDHSTMHDPKPVGVIAATYYWRDMIRNILPGDSSGIIIVFDNACTMSFTYEINGPEVRYVGVGDHHDKSYSKLGVHESLHKLRASAAYSTTYTGVPLNDEFCPMTLHLYPSDRNRARYITNNAAIFTVAAVMVFVFTSLVFCLYDHTVERRQTSIMKTAVRSTAIVSSLFPATVRDQIYPEANEQVKAPTFTTFLNSRKEWDAPTSTKRRPIAELYPETTVLFADIAGFTAWSSVRQPTEVFQLLEAIFGEFDAIAKRRHIFKVETIGDSYVAVAGLPTPRQSHAVVMARFAAECRDRVIVLTQELDKVLGPGTADLGMRFGLNSGPTTAGVLRGEKTRFQLFGDTVNTAARMESNGERNRIQVSQKTAEQIQLAGKGHWLTERIDKVDCKGKGLMTTFWCNPTAAGSSINGTEVSYFTDIVDMPNDAATTGDFGRHIEWTVDTFEVLLKEIVNHPKLLDNSNMTMETFAGLQDVDAKPVAGIPRDEVSEVLLLMQPYDTSDPSSKEDGTNITPVVSAQLRQLIESIARMYRTNPFHNFAHCSHVVMSTKKLLDRISQDHSNSNMVSLDPLTRFAILFAALIHDADHQGVSNMQLVMEGHELAVTYDGKSVAEQHSVQVAWKLFLEPHFSDLRNLICTSYRELQQFRQIVVNCVMATDLFDTDLLSARALRWERSFKVDTDALESEESSNRRATIVIELIVQASDVSHTMQHFTVYQKWNRALLTEMYDAYCSGRMAINPLERWYEGELSFFDNYVIPLAKKLRECGVFGVSSDEFLDYAMDNRLEWELKGRDIVRSFVDDNIRIQREQGTNATGFVEI